MKTKLLTVLILLSSYCLAQVNVITNNKLIINHGDITLYLSNDTSTQVSKHTIKYNDFLNLDKGRDNRWFVDTYTGKYRKEHYLHSGYDLGHLTPSHITSYNDTLNHESFSLFNQAPQVAAFNRGKWAQLEGSVEDSIAKYKKDAIIITGVIYDGTKVTYLGKSRIKIPISYFKVLHIDNKTYCWVGSNINGLIVPISIIDLNAVILKNKNNFSIK
jgi:DNA/RNA endonuclease G (NUC1)